MLAVCCWSRDDCRLSHVGHTVGLVGAFGYALHVVVFYYEVSTLTLDILLLSWSSCYVLIVPQYREQRSAVVVVVFVDVAIAVGRLPLNLDRISPFAAALRHPLGRGPAYSGPIRWGLYSRPIALTLGGEEFRLMMYAIVRVTVG